MQAHPWKLVAPWYRWPRQIKEEKFADAPRKTRPVLQKFDRSDLVEGFLKEPQRSLRFQDAVDQVFTPVLVAAPIFSGGIFKGRSAALYAPRPGPGKPPEPKHATLSPSGIRKIFLETHRRYYLVVCELHCDTPGFPSARADEVCQAGFVVRRRYLKVPVAAKDTALKLLKEIVALQAQAADLDETAPLKPRAAQKRAEKNAKKKADGTFDTERAALLQQIVAKRQELQVWKEENGAQTIHEGWVPGPFNGVGSWQLVEDAPQQLTETTYPLYPLYANPQIPDHDAKGRTLYFGMLPTSALETDARGRARFDDQALYEVSCFVRRHKPDCARRTEAPDCPGELVWSLPTEPYRLASPSDLVGTSNRPITIQAPNLEELAAQAATLPFGKLSPVRIVRPQTLKPVLDGTSLVDGQLVAQQAVCFFAIPLITLVALFVLQIFLPIVVFLFGLWFLLVFKFCIPPEFKVDMALQAELGVIPGEVSGGFDVDFDIQAVADFPGGPRATTENVNQELRENLGEGLAETEGLNADKVTAGLQDFSNEPLVALNAAMVALEKEKNPELAGPDLLANLEYERRVLPSEVVGL